MITTKKESGKIIDYLTDYHLISFCNVVPSWYGTVYENMILVNNRVIDIARKSNDPLMNILCTIHKDKCTLNQYSETYDNPQQISTIINDNVKTFMNYVFMEKSIIILINLSCKY